MPSRSEHGEGLCRCRRLELTTLNSPGSERTACQDGMVSESPLCRSRHNGLYADLQDMPNGHLFPRIHSDWQVIDSA